MLHFHTLAIAELIRDPAGALILRFEVPPELAERYHYREGQHVVLRTRLNDREIRRTYSVCSGADERDLRVAIKRHPGGEFSNWANDHLGSGDSIDVLSPTGSFRDGSHSGDGRLHVALAAGSGITPVLSILRTVLEREAASRFVLLYGNRDRASILFREELEDLKNLHMERLSIHHFLSREERDLPLYDGRLDAARVQMICAGLLEPAAVDAWYLCGPNSMIDDASAALQSAGAAAERIHFERFATARQRKAAAEAPQQTAGQKSEPEKTRPSNDNDCEVTAVLDGVRSQFRMPLIGDTVLDAALAQGLELPYSCKAGVCTTCRARLVEGEVEMDANYGLEPWELEGGFVLCCQSRPRTPRVVLDFDAT